MSEKEIQLQSQIDDLRRELKTVYNAVAQLKENLGVLGFTNEGEQVHTLDQQKFNDWKEKLSPENWQNQDKVFYTEFQARPAKNGIAQPQPKQTF